MGLCLKGLPFAPGNRSRVFPFRESTSDRNANPVVSLQHGKLVLPSRPPGRLQDLRTLLLFASHRSHDISHPGWIFSFCLIVVSLLDRFLTAFPFISTRCCNKRFTSAFLLSFLNRSGVLPPPSFPATRHTAVIMKTSLVLLGSLATLGLAAPTQTISYQWSPELAEFYSAVDNHIQKARARGMTQQPPTCNLSNAVMPVAPTPLPSPAPGLILREVAIGRGVQVRGPQPLCPNPPY